jgi:hypothetical protein
VNNVEFFKIDESGYDTSNSKQCRWLLLRKSYKANRCGTELWANEKLINQNYSETFQLPSDIKSGTYILRTDLLALHGNVFTDGSVEPYGGRGPQFYTHCFK